MGFKFKNMFGIEVEEIRILWRLECIDQKSTSDMKINETLFIQGNENVPCSLKLALVSLATKVPYRTLTSTYQCTVSSCDSTRAKLL